MKRKAAVSIFFAIMAKVALAGTGGSNDELFFALTVLGFLITVVLVFSGADYLKKHGRKLIRSAFALPEKCLSSIRRLIQRKAENLNLQQQIVPSEAIR